MENEIMLALFLGGWKEREYYVLETPFFKSLNGCIFHPSELKFSTDWNWLMEVVEKIESLSNEPKVINWARQNKNIFDFKLTESNKESVYKSCLEFIKWYNQQTK